MRRFSNWLYHYTNRYTVIAFSILFLLHVFVILPSERDVDRIIGSYGGFLAYFKYFIYSPDDFYLLLANYGEAGRQAFIDHRIIKANIFIFSIGAFFTVVTGSLLLRVCKQGSKFLALNTIGFLPAFCDVIENHAQMVLVAVYPERYDWVVIVITTFTAVKWLTLLAALVIFFVALFAFAIKYFKGSLVD